MNLRLKERIAWYNTIAVAITITVVSIVIYLSVYSTSFRRLDESIKMESEEALTNLNWREILSLFTKCLNGKRGSIARQN